MLSFLWIKTDICKEILFLFSLFKNNSKIIVFKTLMHEHWISITPTPPSPTLPRSSPQIYVHIYLCITCWVYLGSLICAHVQHWLIRTVPSTWEFSLEEADSPSIGSHWLCSSSLRVGPSEISLVYIGMTTGVDIILTLSGNTIVESSWVYS